VEIESFDPLEVLRVLNKHAVEYVVVGGFAVASHGVVHATEDLDVVPARGLDNGARLAAALVQLGAEGSAEGARPTAEALGRRAEFRFDTRFGAVHLVRATAGVPRVEDMEKELVSIGEVQFHRASLKAIKEMKRSAGRARDLVDLAELDELEGDPS